MIRHFFKEDPEAMDEETWAMRVNEAIWISQMKSKTLTQALWGVGSKV